MTETIETHHGDGSRVRAVFSRDRSRRYRLTWSIRPEFGTIAYLMLNPSIAGSGQTRDNLDPTLRRCREFTRAAGFGAFAVYNLYSLIDPSPKGLALEDPEDLAHDAPWLETMAGSYLRIVAAWGAHPKATARARAVVDRFLLGRDLHALAATKSGHPGHPLYLSRARTLEPWTPPWSSAP